VFFFSEEKCLEIENLLLLFMFLKKIEATKRPKAKEISVKRALFGHCSISTSLPQKQAK